MAMAHLLYQLLLDAMLTCFYLAFDFALAPNHHWYTDYTIQKFWQQYVNILHIPIYIPSDPRPFVCFYDRCV